MGGAISVHSHLGPGLLESAYQKCLCHELQSHGLQVLCEVPLPIRYRDISIDVGYRMDMVVEAAPADLAFLQSLPVKVTHKLHFPHISATYS